MGETSVQSRLSPLFLEAVHSRKPVAGLSHGFYRYPARFSPLFVRAAIEAFTKPGEVVYDPFMGGGTTLVEASAVGRSAIGTDINSLAVFVSKAKTTVLSEADLLEVRVWACGLVPELNLHRPTTPRTKWAELGYQRNLTGKSTWPIRKTLDLALRPMADSRTQRNPGCLLDCERSRRQRDIFLHLRRPARARPVYLLRATERFVSLHCASCEWAYHDRANGRLS